MQTPITPELSPQRALRAAAAIVAAVLLATSGLLAADAAEAKVKQGPKGGGFYEGPKKTPQAHGKVIWQRDATKLAPIDGAKVNKTILYTSESPKGKRVVTSGSVSIPAGKAPKGGWPVISYAHGTTGTADSCAPTRIRPGSVMAPYVAYMDPQLEEWIDAGYAVVQTDYQGLGTPGAHPYLVGTAEGRSVLDIVAAARQLRPSIGKRFLIAGHSQGGQSGLFAAGLAKSWTPELKLRGTVSYAPGSHIFEQAELLPALTSPSGLSALASLIFEGAATVSKQIKVDALLTGPAAALYPQVKQVCLAQLSQADSFGGIAPADLLQEPIGSTPEFGDVLKEMNPAVDIGPPILLAQGTTDTTVFPFYTDQLNAELVNRGNDVDYITYPGVDHGGIVSAAEDDAMDFFQERLPSE